MFEIQPPVNTAKEWAVSPSQIETFDSTREGCERKWGWKYIAKIPQEQHASAALGSAIHTILESYLRDGIYPDQSTREGEIASAGLHLLPDPGPHIIVEDEVRFYSPAGYLYTGRVDYQFQQIGYNDGELEVQGPIWIIGDHKTTSNFRWMKTREKLLNDTQALVYAAYSLLLTGEDYVGLQWTYYNTRTTKSDQTKVILSARDVAERFERIDRVSSRIHLALATVTDPLDMPANTDACEKFGGCPYRHLCNISIGERWSSRMSNVPGTLPQIPTVNLPGASPAGLPGVPAPAPLPDATAALMAQLQAQAAAAQAAPVAGPSILDQMRQQQALIAAPMPQAPVATLPQIAPPAVAPPVAAPAPIAAVPPPPALPEAQMHSSGAMYEVGALAPGLAAGTWADPTACGKAADFIYPCHCGATIRAWELAKVPRRSDGETCCPSCNRPVPHAAQVLDQFRPPAAINPPEAAQALAVAPPAPTATQPIVTLQGQIQSVQVGPATITTAPAGPPPNPVEEKPKTKAGPGRPPKAKSESIEVTSQQAVRAVWAQEHFSPIQYNYVEVGPFEVYEYPREGESSVQCLARLNAELTAYAEGERARKIASFVQSMPKAG